MNKIFGLEKLFSLRLERRSSVRMFKGHASFRRKRVVFYGKLPKYCRLKYFSYKNGILKNVKPHLFIYDVFHEYILFSFVKTPIRAG